MNSPLMLPWICLSSHHQHFMFAYGGALSVGIEAMFGLIAIAL